MLRKSDSGHKTNNSRYLVKGTRDGERAEATTTASERISLIASIVATLLIRMGSRISFIILSFYLGRRFASATAVATVIEMFYVSELLLSPLVGGLSDRVGRRPFLLLAPALAALATSFLLLAARLFPYLHPHGPGPRPFFDLELVILLLLILAGRLLEGASAGTNVPATLGYITDVTMDRPRLRARVMTAFEIVTIGGIVLGIPLGGNIFRALNTWGFLVVILTHGLTLLIIALCVKESVQQQERQSTKASHPSLFSSLATIRHKRIYTFLPAWFSVNALVGAWTVLTIIILAYPKSAAEHRHPGQLLYGGFDETRATLYVGMFALLFLLGMGGWMFVLPRLRRTTVMLIGLGGLGLAILALSIINSQGENLQSLSPAAYPIIRVMLFIVGAGILLLSGFTPVALTQMGAIAETLPGQRGAVMGLYSVVLAIGQFLGSVLGGICVDLQGFYGLMIFSVIMGLISIASVLYIRAHGHDLLQTGSHLAVQH